MSVKDRIKSSRAANRLFRRPPGLYGSARRTLAGSEQHRAQRLEKILGAAAKTAYGKQHANQPLASWPILEKAAVRSNPARFLVSRQPLRSHASTSGSSGVPLQLWRGPSSVAFEQAALDLVFESVSVDMLNGRLAVLRGDVIKDPNDLGPPFWRIQGAGRRLLISGPHLSAVTIRSIAAQLQAFQPEALWAYPSLVASLARLVRDEGLEVTVPAVVTSSESFSTSERQLVAKQFGAKVIDYYGQAERAAFAVSMKPDAYRFNPGYGVVELIPTAPGLAEIVGTGLGNPLQPLIRYRTGDLVRVETTNPEHLAQVAEGQRDFLGVLGRTSDYLVGPNGEVLMGLDQICRDVPEVERMQVVQQGAHVELRILPSIHFSYAALAKLNGNAARRLPKQLNWSVKVVSELERANSGKIPFVIRR